MCRRIRELSRNLDIAYATYLGGSDDDTAYGIAVDSSGAAWLVGRTASADFPVSTSVPFGGWIVIGPNHEGDAFAAQLSPDGKSLQFFQGRFAMIFRRTLFNF